MKKRQPRTGTDSKRFLHSSFCLLLSKKAHRAGIFVAMQPPNSPSAVGATSSVGTARWATVARAAANTNQAATMSFKPEFQSFRNLLPDGQALAEKKL
jgi:hypothetical protein